MVAIKGGSKLRAKMAELSQGLSQRTTLQTGFMAGATEDDGTSIPMLAAIHNWGAPSKGIPPRPFFTNMVKDNVDSWGAELAADLKISNMDPKAAMALLGATMEGQLREAITSGSFAPLTPRTLRARGVNPNTVYNPADSATWGAAPLRRTGAMLNSITSKVK